MQTIVTIKTFPAPRVFRTKPGLTSLRRFTATDEVAAITPPYSAQADALVSFEQSDNRVPHGIDGFLRISSGGSAGYYIIAAQVDLEPAPLPVDVDAAVKKAVNVALDHVQPAADALDKAISEARIR